MKNELVRLIESNMEPYLNEIQIVQLNESLKSILNKFEVFKKDNNLSVDESKENHELLMSFLSAKQIEGCSEKTINYYRNTIFKMLESVNLKIESIKTEDLRKYLPDYKNQSNASKSTIDNIRRVLSSFFSWLEDEGHISKNPVRRIHKIKTKG
ncbi:site-specific integrase [Methanobrevibacter sp.]|uniref:site-specific integrase n=1 Tax=Methanobrevibacter sp. TaxID=66852 RepID=UPI00388EDF55